MTAAVKLSEVSVSLSVALLRSTPASIHHLEDSLAARLISWALHRILGAEMSESTHTH